MLSFVVQPAWQSYISSYCFGINLSSIFCRIYIDKRNNCLPVTCKSALICESKRPTFRSDRYQFTVVMPNGVSSKTIKRHIKEMDNVRYIGRGFSGQWEIADDKKR